MTAVTQKPQQRVVVGIDEVGRGCLAGPCLVCAAALPGSVPDDVRSALTDSKKLSPKRREVLSAALHEHAIFAFAEASVAEIERLNIRRATLAAMSAAGAAIAESLGALDVRFLVDGRDLPELPGEAEAIVGGDGSIPEISAASILAKVTRDAAMRAAAQRYPGYGWVRNAGYGTPEHVAAIRALGSTPLHRPSFLRRLLAESESR